MSVEEIEYQFKHDELDYPDALTALMQSGIDPKEALDLVGKWDEELIDDGW